MKKGLILCIAGLLWITTAYGQNEKFKALFIYNFTNYIDWPNPGSSFVIAVYGDSPIISELQAISKIKKVSGSSIEVRRINSVSEIGNANIVFVPATKKRFVTEINKGTLDKSILIISDVATSDFGINFLEINGKQSFQISKSNIEKHGLKVSNSLIALGVAVK
jgi:hypothetical protein